MLYRENGKQLRWKLLVRVSGLSLWLRLLEARDGGGLEGFRVLGHFRV